MAKNFLKEFKEFAIRGNVLDLAVGVVVGTAFGKIVSSLVADIITPLISLTTGAVDFKHLSLPLREAAGGVSAVTINYGAFLQTIFDFLIIAFSIFIALRFLNALRRKLEKEIKAEGVIVKSHTDKVLEEIRDLIKERKR